MKKIWFMVLVALVLFALTACRGAGEPESAATPPSESEEHSEPADEADLSQSEDTGFTSPEDAVRSYFENQTGMIVAYFALLFGDEVDSDATEEERLAQFERVAARAEDYTLTLLGFVPPEALSEVYATESYQAFLAARAEEYDATQLVSRIAAFELDGETHLLFFDVIEFEEEWHIFQLGGSINMLLQLPPTLHGIPPEFMDALLGGVDLQTILIPA